MTYHIRDTFSQKRFGDVYEGKHMYSLENGDNDDLILYYNAYKDDNDDKIININKNSLKYIFNLKEDSVRIFEKSSINDDNIISWTERENNKNTNTDANITIKKLISSDENFGLYFISGSLCVVENVEYDDDLNLFKFKDTTKPAYLTKFSDKNKYKKYIADDNNEDHICEWKNDNCIDLFSTDNTIYYWNNWDNKINQEDFAEIEKLSFDYMIWHLYDDLNYKYPVSSPVNNNSKCIPLIKFDLSSITSKDTIKKMADYINKKKYPLLLIQPFSSQPLYNVDEYVLELSKIVSIFRQYNVKCHVIGYASHSFGDSLLTSLEMEMANNNDIFSIYYEVIPSNIYHSFFYVNKDETEYNKRFLDNYLETSEYQDRIGFIIETTNKQYDNIVHVVKNFS